MRIQEVDSVTDTQMLEFVHASFAGRIGVAREDITPPVGIYSRNWGAARHDLAESIHRPLTLTALTLQSDTCEEPLVLVAADLGWWRGLRGFREFQSRVLKELSLPSRSFLFALSHTHAAVPLVEKDSGFPGSELLDEYAERLFDATVRAVRRALGEVREATLDWHTGRCGLAAVRDLPEPDSSSRRLVCGFNPNVRADDTLLVGRVTDRSGKIVATLVNYACHPTTLAWDNTAISPDYVGAMRELVEEATGAPTLFLQGASGELAPRYQYVGDSAVADRHGYQLGHAVLATLHDMEPPATKLVFDRVVESGAPLAVWRHEPIEPSPLLRSVEETVELPVKDWPSAEELERQRQACTDRALEERLRRRRDIRRSLGDGKTFRASIWAWRIGDAFLVGSMWEAYSQLQRELRRRFPGRCIACVGLLNGSLGYLPPAQLYDQDVYQVWQTPIDRGGLEKVIEAMGAAIERMSSEVA